MKSKIILFTALATLSLTLTAARSTETVRPQGPTTEKRHTLKAFDAIAVSSIIKLELTNGEPSSLAVRTQENVHPWIEVAVKDGVLHIGLKPGVSFKGAVEITAHVSAPTLCSIEISGAAGVTVPGTFTATTPLGIEVNGAGKCSGKFASSGKIAVNVNGAGKCSAGFTTPGQIDFSINGAANLSGEVQCQALNIKANGAAQVTLGGRCTDCEVVGAGAVMVQCEDLSYETLYAKALRASNAYFTTMGKPKVAAWGESAVSLKDPQTGKKVIVKGT